jgi:hypothetical protein
VKKVRQARTLFGGRSAAAGRTTPEVPVNSGCKTGRIKGREGKLEREKLSSRLGGQKT